MVRKRMKRGLDKEGRGDNGKKNEGKIVKRRG